MEEFEYEISKEEINSLPIASFTGKISVVSTRDEADAAVENLRRYSALGFDTESRPSFNKGEHHPISLVQLASDDVAYLFRINRLGRHEGLKSLLEDPSVLKIGLGISKEIGELKLDMDNRKREGFVDLERIAQRCGFKQRGVRALSAFFMKIRISKGAQKTNWARKDLTDQQILYAATDAWVCLRIFEEMKSRGFAESLCNSEDKSDD